MPCEPPNDCEDILDGQISWSMKRDSEGYREYRIKHRLKQDDTPGSAAGPFTALNTAGLPVVGSIWSFDADVDTDAWCRFDADVKPVYDNERCAYWDVEQIFSTKPLDKCRDSGTSTLAPDNPLTERPIISGGFNKYTEQATVDKDDVPITNSAFEPIKGTGTEVDKSRPIVRITINEAFLDLPGLAAIIDTVNEQVLWGFDPRCVKLSNITWEQKYYNGCDCYYTITYEFEINIDTFDRELLDEGTKALFGEWNPDTITWTLRNIGVFGLGIPPDPLNPTHYVRYTDINGNPTRGLLNGAGIPTLDGTDSLLPAVEIYQETDFEAVLDIPSSLECPV